MGKVKYEKIDQLAKITIDSPPANALSSAIIQEINQFLDEIESDLSIKAVVLHGEGRFFSAGADIKEFTDIKSPEEFSRLSAAGQKVFDRIENFSIPIIAAIHGAALGGGLELAMACHLRVVSESSKLGLPELTLGLIPGFAGTQRLSRLVGDSKALELILTGDSISGKEAAKLGLVNITTATDDLVLETALKLAEKIVNKSKPTIEKILQLVSYAKAGKYEEGAKKESAAFGKIFANEDAKEGISAFLEKRKPNFIDK